MYFFSFSSFSIVVASPLSLKKKKKKRKEEGSMTLFLNCPASFPTVQKPSPRETPQTLLNFKVVAIWDLGFDLFFMWSDFFKI